MPASRPPDARSTLVVVAVAAVAVGVAATGSGLLMPGGSPGGAAATAIRVAGVVAAVAAVVALVTRWGGPVRVPVRDGGLTTVLLTAAGVMAAVAVLTQPFSDVGLDPAGDTTTTASTTTTERTTGTTGGSVPATSIPPPPQEDDSSTLLGHLGRLLAAVVIVVVLCLVAYALVILSGRPSWRWRRTTGPPPGVGEAVEPLDAGTAAAGLQASLDAVTADRAPRDAIDEAYARLLAALADAGAGRRAHEAPHEHLHRVLVPLGVRPAPLHRLAELFVLARFSQHPVTAAHRDEATAALRRALDHLEAAAPPEPAAGDAGVAPR